MRSLLWVLQVVSLAFIVWTPTRRSHAIVKSASKWKSIAWTSLKATAMIASKNQLVETRRLHLTALRSLRLFKRRKLPIKWRKSPIKSRKIQAKPLLLRKSVESTFIDSLRLLAHCAPRYRKSTSNHNHPRARLSPSTSPNPFWLVPRGSASKMTDNNMLKLNLKSKSTNTSKLRSNLKAGALVMRLLRRASLLSRLKWRSVLEERLSYTRNIMWTSTLMPLLPLRRPPARREAVLASKHLRKSDCREEPSARLRLTLAPKSLSSTVTRRSAAPPRSKEWSVMTSSSTSERGHIATHR